MGIVQIIETEINWFRSHEKFLIVTALAGAILWGHHEYRGYLAARDLRKDTAANAILATQVQANRDLATHAEQDAQNYKQLLEQIIPQIQQLQASIQTRNSTAQIQQKTDETLPPNQLANRIMALAPGGIIRVESDGASYKFDPPETVAVAKKLELVEPLQRNESDLQQIIVDKDKQVGALTTSTADLNRQIGGLNHQLNDQEIACKSDIRVAVDKEKKKHKWYALAGIIGIEIARAFLTGKL